MIWSQLENGKRGRGICWLGCCSFGSERGKLGTMVLNQGVGIKEEEKEKGWFGSWREKALKREASGGGGSYVFPSSVEKDPECVGTHKKMSLMENVVHNIQALALNKSSIALCA